MSGEGLTNENDGSVGLAEKISNWNTKFCLSMHKMTLIFICSLTTNKFVSLKPIIKLSTFLLSFVKLPRP